MSGYPKPLIMKVMTKGTRERLGKTNKQTKNEKPNEN